MQLRSASAKPIWLPNERPPDFLLRQFPTRLLYDLDMSEKDEKNRHIFKAHESARLNALNGLPLARWWQRLLGYAIDLFIAIVIWIPIEVLWRRYVLQEHNIDLKWDFHEKGNLVVMLLYWATANYLGNGGPQVNGWLVHALFRSPASAWVFGSPSSVCSAMALRSLKGAWASRNSSGIRTACARKIV
jgi:hypothetical protein